MSADQGSLMTLLMGVFGVLASASVIGYAIAIKVGNGPSQSVVENLNARIQAWWMIILLSLAFLWGRTGVILLFLVCSFNALRELITLTNARRADHWMLAAVFFIVLPLQYYLIYIDWYAFYSVFIPVYVFLLMPVVSALRGEVENFLIRVAEVQWAAMVTIYLVSHVPALLSLNIPGYEGMNIRLIAFLIIVVQASDVLQYVWGKLVGKRKIAPRLSSSKTVEGFLGGVGSATLLGACLWWVTPFTFWQAGLLSLVIALMGFFGGLVMSAIKRDRGVKDWGDVITGHGGYIDRLDSVIFSAPIFFHLARYWVARLITRLAQNAAVHVAFAFLLMGSWAVYANADHPSPKPLLAGLVQGALSGTITYALKRSLDGLRARMAHGLGWWLPPLIALAASLSLLITAHLLAGTPEVTRTIAVPFSVAAAYAIIYNFLMWKKGTAR